jgi:hypothetical protein
MSVINGTPTVRLLGKSPREIFCGAKANDILTTVVDQSNLEVVDKRDWPKRFEGILSTFRRGWEEMISEVKTKNKDGEPVEANAELFVREDLVMFALSPAESVEKLSRKWTGPMVVKKRNSQHSYTLWDPFEKKEFEAHPGRMRIFNYDGDPEDFNGQRLALSDEFRLVGVSDLRQDQVTKEFTFEVKWSGEKFSNNTTEDACNVLDLYPEITGKFMEKNSKKPIVKLFREHLLGKRGECRDTSISDKEFHGKRSGS